MKIVNRGYILVTPKKPFVDWAQKQDEELLLFGEVEPSIYLIDEDFFDDEPIIKAKFKGIFRTELEAVTDDEESYPIIDFDTFLHWFNVQLGSTVYDAESNGLNRE